MTLRTGEVIISEQGRCFSIPESISVFGFSISFYGVFLVLAALVGGFVIIREAGRKQQDTEKYISVLTLSIVFALLAARVYYVLFQWNAFAQNPVSIFNFRVGGLAYFGALLGAWITTKVYCRRKEGNFEAVADTLCLGAAAAAPFVWIGCAMVREPVGRFYDGMFSVRIPQSYLNMELKSVYLNELAENTRRIGEIWYVSVHPVALYGVVGSLVIFFVMMFLKRRSERPGDTFHLYLLLNAVLCFVLELFRAERCCIWGTDIPVNCVVAAVLMVTISAGWLQRALKQTKVWEKHL